MLTTIVCEKSGRLEKRLKAATRIYIEQENRLQDISCAAKSLHLHEQQRKMEWLKQVWRSADVALDEHRRHHGCSALEEEV